MANFDHDYAVFDDYGMVELKCMRCGALIGAREYIEVPSKTVPGKAEKVLAFKKHSHLRYREITLSDGSTAYAMVCSGCSAEDLDTAKLTDQIKRAWVLEKENGGWPQKEIDAHSERVKDLSVAEDLKITLVPANFDEALNALKEDK